MSLGDPDALFVGEQFDQPARPVKGFLKGTRDREDLSYHRPYVIGGGGARW